MQLEPHARVYTSGMAESLVALRDRRELVITRLSEGYAQDMFDVDELERRLDLAHGASSVAQLDALIADLTPSTSSALVSAGPAAIDDPSRADAKKLRVIMSSVERRGRWLVPRTLDLRVLWGNAELDFRDASLGPGITTIHVRVFMGNFEVVLPPNLGRRRLSSSGCGSVTACRRIRSGTAAQHRRRVRSGTSRSRPGCGESRGRDKRERRERKQARRKGPPDGSRKWGPRREPAELAAMGGPGSRPAAARRAAGPPGQRRWGDLPGARGRRVELFVIKRSAAPATTASARC
jgi:hypothetical protein